MGFFFNWSKGDVGFNFSDDMGMDQDGNLQHRISDNLSLDLNTGDINFVSGWKKKNNDGNDFLNQ